MMAGPDRDAFLVEDRAEVVRVDAVDDKGDETGLVTRRADDGQALDGRQLAGRVQQELVLNRAGPPPLTADCASAPRASACARRACRAARGPAEVTQRILICFRPAVASWAAV